MITPEAEKRRAIARMVADAYMELPGVDSLAVGGSTARGNADEHSDIDIWMTCSSLPDEDVRKCILTKLDESKHPVLTHSMGGGMTHAEALVVSGVQVGIFPGTNEDLLAVGNDIDKHLGEPCEIGVADFHDCIVLYDPKGLYASVKERLSDYPIAAGTRFMQNCLRKICTLCTVDIPRAVRNGGWMHMLASRSDAQEALLRIAFILNKDYFPHVKDAEWLLGSLERLPADFGVKMRNLAQACSDIEQRGMLLDAACSLASLAVKEWPESLDHKIIQDINAAHRANSCL